MNNRAKTSGHELIEVTPAFERLVHWLFAMSCILLLITGFGLMFQTLNMIAGFFGGYYSMKYLHNISGLVFMASGFSAVIVWFKEGTKFTVDDIDWLSRAGGYLWSSRIVPEAGRFNAGQKLYYILKSVTWILMSITGLIIWFPFLFSRVMVTNSYWLHVLGVALLAGSVIIHIFLGTFGNPGSIQSMLGGKCTRAWARLQHGRWLREYDSKQKQRQSN